MTTSTQPKTGRCRSSYMICPHLVQALVSAHVSVFALFHLFIFQDGLYNRRLLVSSFLSRSASLCPADRGQNNCPPRNHW